MADKETVLKGLEMCTDLFQLCKNGCPYYDAIELPKCNQLKKDALELLKELEEQNQFISGQLIAYHKVLAELTELSYPHNFQHEAPWVAQYCRDITEIIKKAYEVLENDPD